MNYFTDLYLNLIKNNNKSDKEVQQSGKLRTWIKIEFVILLDIRNDAVKY